MAGHMKHDLCHGRPRVHGKLGPQRCASPPSTLLRTRPPLPAQVKGAEKVLYGLDDVVGSSDIIIVEGEMDKLALEEAGFRNVVSVSARGWLGDCVVPSAAQQGKAGP